MTVSGSRFGAPVAVAAVSSRTHALTSVDWRLEWKDADFFGEVALSGCQPDLRPAREAVGWLTGIRLNAGRLRLFGLVRHYGVGFGSLRGATFAAYGGHPNNESGRFAAASWRPTSGTRIQASLDRHHRVAPEGDGRPPARGSRFTAGVSRRLRRGLVVDTDFKQDSEAVTVQNQAGVRVRRRLRFRTDITRGILRLHPWLSSGWASGPATSGPGRAAGLRAVLGHGRSVRVDT